VALLGERRGKEALQEEKLPFGNEVACGVFLKKSRCSLLLNSKGWDEGGEVGQTISFDIGEMAR